LLVIPALAGLHGPEEIKAFDRLPPVPAAMCDRICRLVLLALLPAVAERDLKSFGAALEELQTHVGRCFAPAQGGTYARPELETIAHAMKAEKLKGVGQSSWGPTLYGFSDQASDVCDKIAERLRSRLGLESGQVFWTNANQGGARLGCLNDDVHAGPD
jgi:beta-RFAP synthase